jgi:hypothetical protein
MINFIKKLFCDHVWFREGLDSGLICLNCGKRK